MTTSVIQTDKIHESTLAALLVAHNTDSPFPRQPTSLHHSTVLRFCFAVSLLGARLIESKRVIAVGADLGLSLPLH